MCASYRIRCASHLSTNRSTASSVVDAPRRVVVVILLLVVLARTTARTIDIVVDVRPSVRPSDGRQTLRPTRCVSIINRS
jgi:hypothetical protein